MAAIRRLTDSCVVVTTDGGATLFDPGFHTFDSGAVDLDSIGDIQRVLITHEHLDHVKPDFVRWLRDRSVDVTVYANPSVAELLAPHDVAVETGCPDGVTFEDVTHEVTPMGTAPPNRAFTIDGVFTHPGDSYQPNHAAPVMALGLIVPWGTARASIEFAVRLAPRQVVPVHDFYLDEAGRAWITGLAAGVLAEHNIEMIRLAWGETATV